jgi:hypothetical protein
MNDWGSYLVVLEMPQGEYSIHCSGDEFVWDAAARHGISLPASSRKTSNLKYVAMGESREDGHHCRSQETVFLLHPKGPRSRTVCNISALPQEVRDLVAAAVP